MRMLLTPKVRHGVKVTLALLSIPLIAWMLEFAYNHYLSPRFRRTSTPNMIMSNHGHEGYNYAGLNAIFRKLRRLELQHDRNVHKFVHTQDSVDQVSRMLKTLEAEQDSFTSYYYNTLDLYTKNSMPLKLRRRLHYYRHIIQRSIGRARELAETLGIGA